MAENCGESDGDQRRAGTQTQEGCGQEATKGQKQTRKTNREGEEMTEHGRSKPAAKGRPSHHKAQKEQRKYRADARPRKTGTHSDVRREKHKWGRGPRKKETFTGAANIRAQKQRRKQRGLSWKRAGKTVPRRVKCKKGGEAERE